MQAIPLADATLLHHPWVGTLTFPTSLLRSLLSVRDLAVGLDPSKCWLLSRTGKLGAHDEGRGEVVECDL